MSFVYSDEAVRSPVTRVGADAHVLFKEALRRVREADRRSVCIRSVLYYSMGYSCQEVSEILGVPIGTAKRRISQGRKMLGDVLGR